MDDRHKNRFQSNKKYFTISIYAICVTLASALIIRFIFMWDGTRALFGSIMKTLSPFIAGAFIAFVLNPLVNRLDKKLLRDRLHIKKPGLRYTIAVVFTYLLIIGLIVLFFAFLVPNIVHSSIELWPRLRAAYESVLDYIQHFEERHPDVDFTFLNNLLKSIGENALNFDRIKEALSNILPVIFTTGVSIVRFVLDFVIAIVASIYLLYDRGIAARAIRRFTYAVLPQDRGHSVLHTAKECGRIFQSFITGKAVDSLIMGVLCYIGMVILRMPGQYNILISVIFGVTNMIPYFGPLIGEALGTLILLMIDPLKALIFLIMAFALQQLDGLVLGPRILGNTTGLRPILILFAVTVGGAVGGVVGMFLGVPVFASILYVVEILVNRSLRLKGVRLDERTGKLLPDAPAPSDEGLSDAEVVAAALAQDRPGQTPDASGEGSDDTSPQDPSYASEEAPDGADAPDTSYASEEDPDGADTPADASSPVHDLSQEKAETVLASAAAPGDRDDPGLI